MLSEDAGRLLLKAARHSIETRLNGSGSLSFEETFKQDLPNEFKEKRACFVTLKMNEQLRGCIGNLEANSSLIKSVVRNARSAAFSDPRFSPLSTEELDNVHISISVLTPSEPITFSDETSLIEQLCPNVDGLTIELGHKHATFLPAVWESLQRPEDFLQQLKLKAGMDMNETIEKAWRYKSESYSE